MAPQADARTLAWNQSLDQLVGEWSAIVGAAPTPDVADWERMLADLRIEQLSIVNAGQWVSGPRDLLSVIDRQGDELTHSSAIAWLLTPTARHGLGDRVLSAVVSAAWADERVPVGPVTVRREVGRSSARTGDRAIADIVVNIGDSVLVIENKVWAGEGVRQCERLYQAWLDEAADVRWVLLTRTGHAPSTCESPEAQEAWRSLSYRELSEMLMRALRAAEPAKDLVARLTVVEYLATLASALATSPAEGLDEEVRKVLL